MSGLAGEAWRRLRLLFAQGRGTLIGADTVQVQVLSDEVLASVQRVEPYGLSYRPKAGCEVYLIFPAGDRGRGVALLCGDKRYQLDLQDGEVALHDDDGNFVKLGSGGVATVKASSKVIADTPLLKTTGNAEVMGDLLVHGELKHAGVDVGAAHTHTSTTPGLATSGVRT